MLSEAERVSLFRHVAVGQHLKHSSLLEVFIAAFFDAVTNIVRGGLLRQYRECEEDLQVVRGRILADRQFSVHANRPDALACRFDDLTGDNLWNRLLKAGMRAVRPWISSGELSRRWVELMAAFDEIEDERPSAMALNRLVFDRQAARYRSAIDWVRWILALLSPDLRAGRNAAPGLLFDMNVLFESAVSTAMQRRAPDVGFQVSSQDTGRHLATVVESAGKRAFGIRPDLVIRQGEEVIAVGDTKWKRVGMSKTGYLLPAEADMYQMHAYAATFGCEKLALVYPWYSELAESKETAFELPAFGTKHPVVHVVCIDLHTVPFTLVRGGNIPGFASLFKSC
jgi:5-methylcytosine-specific restriction enzyme subunit McrC